MKYSFSLRSIVSFCIGLSATDDDVARGEQRERGCHDRSSYRDEAGSIVARSGSVGVTGAGAVAACGAAVAAVCAADVAAVLVIAAAERTCAVSGGSIIYRIAVIGGRYF